ncbi:hypothetical protein MTO96_030294 [Rhipicephalus appendiculatus]
MESAGHTAVRDAVASSGLNSSGPRITPRSGFVTPARWAPVAKPARACRAPRRGATRTCSSGKATIKRPGLIAAVLLFLPEEPVSARQFRRQCRRRFCRSAVESATPIKGPEPTPLGRRVRRTRRGRPSYRTPRALPSHLGKVVRFAGGCDQSGAAHRSFSVRTTKNCARLRRRPRSRFVFRGEVSHGAALPSRQKHASRPSAEPNIARQPARAGIQARGVGAPPFPLLIRTTLSSSSSSFVVPDRAPPLHPLSPAPSGGARGTKKNRPRRRGVPRRTKQLRECTAWRRWRVQQLLALHLIGDEGFPIPAVRGVRGWPSYKRSSPPLVWGETARLLRKRLGKACGLTEWGCARWFVRNPTVYK